MCAFWAMPVSDAGAQAYSEPETWPHFSRATPDIESPMLTSWDDPSEILGQSSSLENYINRLLFPAIDNLDTGLGDPSSNTGSLMKPLDGQSYSSTLDDTSRLASVTETNRLENSAREQAYKILSNMVFSINLVQKLQRRLEHYTKPMDLYRGEDGSVSTSYFGIKPHNAKTEGAAKVFSLSIGISSSHNINYIATIYNRFQISLLNGNRLLAQYRGSGGRQLISFEADRDESKAQLRYTLRF